MDINREDIIKIEGRDYCVLLNEEISGVRYLYVAEMEKEDITGDFYLYRENGGQLEKVVNSDELKQILPSIITLLSEE